MGGLLLLIGLIGIAISLIGFIIAFIRKKAFKGWAIAMLLFVAMLLISLVISPIDNNETTTESKQSYTVEETEADNFARQNDISVDLAKDIEYALSQSDHEYSLLSIYNWEELDNYANGKRYKAWMNQEYEWIFYVNGDKVESIRQQKDLSFIYQAE